MNRYNYNYFAKSDLPLMRKIKEYLENQYIKYCDNEIYKDMLREELWNINDAIGRFEQVN